MNRNNDKESYPVSIEQRDTNENKNEKVSLIEQKVIPFVFDYPKPIDYNARCFQSNDLTQAIYSMSASEKKIFVIMIHHIKPNDETFQAIEFRIKDLLYYMEGGESENYSFLLDTITRLQKRIIRIRERNTPVKSSSGGKRYDSVLQVQLIGHYRHFPAAGVIELSFHHEMMPYLINLKRSLNFTVLNLSSLMQLSSVYSIRMYELCSQYKDTGWFVFSVTAIKEMFGLNEKYKLYADFKRNAIDKAKEELATKGDLFFDYLEVKPKGKKVESLFFTVHNPTKGVDAEQEELKDKLAKEFQLSKSFIDQLIVKVSRGEIMKTLYEIRLNKMNNIIKGSLGGYARGTFVKKFPEILGNVSEAKVIGLPISQAEIMANMIGDTLPAFLKKNRLTVKDGVVCPVG